MPKEQRRFGIKTKSCSITCLKLEVIVIVIVVSKSFDGGISKKSNLNAHNLQDIYFWAHGHVPHVF